MTLALNLINTYFTEEKIQSLFFIIIGVISILSALIFLFVIKYSFFKGIALPFLLVGLIQLIIGTTIYVRSPKDIIRVENIIKNEPKKIHKEELPRVKIILEKFVIYKWIEITLLLVGIILFSLFYNSPQPFWKGIGLGIIIQTSILLSLDFVAENRTKIYTKHLTVLGQTLTF